MLAALNEQLNQLAALPLAHSLTGGGTRAELPSGAQGPGAPGQFLAGLPQFENGASLAALSLAGLPKDMLAKLQSMLAADSTAQATTGALPAGAPESAPTQAAALYASNAMSAQLMHILRDHGVKLDVTLNNNWTSQPSFGGTLFTASQIAGAGFGSANGGTDSNFFGHGFLGEGSANSSFSGASLPDVASGAMAAAPSGQVSVNDFHGNLLALMGTEPGAAIALRSAAQLQPSGAFDGQRIPGTPPEAVISQISVHIQRALQDGLDRVRIQLDPAELGRIDVKLELGHDGRLQAAIGAERHETLELLQRDARQLERALQEAGFKTDQQNFSFDLGFGKHDQTAGSAGKAPNTGEQLSAGPDALSELTTPATPRSRHDGAIDIQA
jgi:flagellar hook-length control protein FliK